MTGRELLACLEAFSPEALDLHVLGVGCNREDGEGARVGTCPGPYPWIPDPVLLVATVSADFSQIWLTRAR